MSQRWVAAADRPECARCGKPVERIESYEDPTAMRLVIVVRCHGEHEEARLDREVVEDHRFAGFGVAFLPRPALPAMENRRALPRAR